MEQHTEHARPFLWRFIRYQAERFPLHVLVFTTLAVIFSLGRVVDGSIPSGDRLGLYVAVTALGLLYMLHIRFFDDVRDFHHDNTFYPDRPIQRGLISYQELQRSARAVILIEIGIIAMVHIELLIWYMPVIGYSLCAAKDFFAPHSLRKHYFSYTVLQTVQLALMLLFFHVLMEGTVLLQTTTVIHFIFALETMILIEWVRKMRAPADENLSRDTYSAQLGIRGSMIGLFGHMAVIIGTLAWLLQRIGTPAVFLFAVVPGVVGMVIASVMYQRNASRPSILFLQGASLFFYFTAHGVIIFGK